MYGRTLLGPQSIYPTSCLAAGDGVHKPGGITIDWTTVTAVSGSDVTLTDGSVIKIGQKYLRYGQVMTKITSSGLFGPYDSAAADGRQTLTRGNCAILEQTILQFNELGFTTVNADQVGALVGGTFWKLRLLATSGTHSLAAGPTYTELEAPFPEVKYALD